MRFALWFALLLSCGSLLCACATAPCKAEVGEYREMRLDASTALLSFYTPTRSARPLDETDLIYSCAEVTTAAGYDYFVMVGGDTTLSLHTAETGKNLSYQFDHGPAARLYAGTVIIKMFKGPKPPSLWHAYDARALMSEV